MDYLTLPLSAVFGLIAPLVISFLASSEWSTQLKLALSGAVSFVFALFAVLMTQGIPSSVEGVFSSAGIVFTVATMYYKAYFENTELNQNLVDMEVLHKNPIEPEMTVEEAAAEIQAAETEESAKA